MKYFSYLSKVCANACERALLIPSSVLTRWRVKPGAFRHGLSRITAVTRSELLCK